MIRLRGCTGWFGSSLGTDVRRYIFSRYGWFFVLVELVQHWKETTGCSVCLWLVASVLSVSWDREWPRNVRTSLRIGSVWSGFSGRVRSVFICLDETACHVSYKYWIRWYVILNTVNSRYLEVPGTLKYFEVSVPWHIRFAESRKKQTEQPHFTNEYIIRLQKLRDILKILWKRGEIAPLFHNILLPVVRFPC